MRALAGVSRRREIVSGTGAGTQVSADGIAHPTVERRGVLPVPPGGDARHSSSMLGARSAVQCGVSPCDANHSNP
jgi:hypothetical protein